MSARRLVIPLAAGAILVAGCGASAPAGTTALVTTDTGVTGEYLPASMSQIADGTAFQQTLSTLEKELFEDCIRGYGFGPQAQAYAFANLNLMPLQAMSGYTQNQEAAVGLVNLASVARSGMLAPVYVVGLRPNVTGVPPAEQRALQADQWRCWSKASQPARQLSQQGFALWRQWYSAEVRLLTSTQVRPATKVFGACVTHQGAPRTASESLGQFLNWLQRQVNRGVYRSSGPGPQPAVAPRQQLDAHWSGVFSKCATPLVLLLQRLLPVAQQAFVQEHFGQVTALERLAATTITDLEQLTERQF